MSSIDSFLDSSIDGNSKVLPDLLESLKREREKLKNQLFGLNVQGCDQANEWDRVASETRKTISELEEVDTQCKELQQAAVKDDGAVCEKILPTLRELDETERAKNYLLWVKKINQISHEVTSNLTKGNTDQSVMLYSKLSDMFDSLSSTTCVQLNEYVTKTCEEHRIQLKEALSSQYNQLLKIVSWPHTKDMSVKALDTWKNRQPEFSSCFKHLLVVDKTRREYCQTHIPDIDDPLVLPLELLVAPLRKRFRYHFYGERKTNAQDKPEWYFTQVSQWISDYDSFLLTHIQPHLKETQYDKLNVKNECTRGLVQELVRKIRHELNPTSNNHTLNNDYLFSHLIDELLQFDKELCTLHSYPDLYPMCIVIVQEESVLCRWRNLEKQFAAEKLKAITESKTAWDPAYGSLMGEDDETRVPECAERFMQLIAGITERYRQIPFLLCKLQFLELQADLLLEFSHDLSHAITANSSSPLSNGFIAYLNASNYIVSVLKQWGEETFFLELHYYHKHVNGEPTSNIAQLEALRKADSDFAELEGTAFEEVTKIFESLCDNMIETLTTHCVHDLESNAYSYKKERWHNISIVADPSLFELSPSALKFLLSLQKLLHFLKSSISPLVQNKLFEKLFYKLDDLLLHQIIFSNQFNRSGTEQIHHDITQVIKPLAANCLKDSFSASAILKRTCDACQVLKQPSSNIDHLQSILELCINGKDESAYEEVMALLREKQVSFLSLEEIHKVTKLLID